jgi:Kef-type K+ transport system membrane component KefB
MGIFFEGAKQPVINGYLVAGAVLGPGGLGYIKELVQVESLAQLGVQLLLFGLGRELSLSKLRAVWGVALLGGFLQILALMLLGGMATAMLMGRVAIGVFIGALLSMSSTSVVVKCLEVTKATGTVYGQITIGTLILQDCTVGLMFALMPAFAPAAVVVQSSAQVAATAAAVEGATAASSAADAAVAVALASSSGSDAAVLAVLLLIVRVLLKLAVLLVVAVTLAKTLLPVLLRLLLR